MKVSSSWMDGFTADFRIEEAIHRGQVYTEAGADVVFIVSMETPGELERIAIEI